MRGRKLTICTKCGKEKLNYGYNMCSACLRKWKRQTRPLFYLRTCWGEIKRRSTQKVPNREYKCFGQDFCTKDEFVEKFLTDETFLKIYKNWQRNNFERGLAPSIDRIDSSKGYTLDNIQFLNNIENAKKQFCIPTAVLSIHDDLFVFESVTEAAKFLESSSSDLCWYRDTKKIFKDTYYIINFKDLYEK